MSAIARPRLYFRGHTWWDPSTFNNNDNFPTYDAANVRLNMPYLYTQGVYAPEQFRRWAITSSYDATQDEHLPPAEWNYYGSMASGFVSPTAPAIEDPAWFDRPAGGTTVTGWSDEAGTYPAEGPWAAAQVTLNPDRMPTKMCDVNPAAFWSTQLFADRLQVGSPDAVGFGGALARRMCSRFPNLQNNYDATGELLIAGSMNVIWQGCLDRRDLALFDDQSGPGRALADALDRPGVAGLMIRFSTFETLYFNGAPFRALTGSKAERLSARMGLMAELYADYAAQREAWSRGERTTAPARPVNRAYSRTVGWIAPWHEGALCSEPEGRLLFAGATLLGETPRTVTPSQAQTHGDQAGQPYAPLPLGPTPIEAEIRGGAVTRVVLDTAVTLPKLWLGGPVARYGRLALRLGTQTIACIEPAAYADAAWAETGGLVDVALDAPVPLDAWYGADLGLVAHAETDAPVEALVEQAFTARCDLRGVYVDEPGTGAFARPDPTFTVRVQHRGRRPPPGTRLVVAQYDAGFTRVGPPGQSPMVELLADPARHPEAIGAGGLACTVTPGAGDWAEATLAVRALRPGIPNLPLLALPPAAALPTLARTIGATAIVDVPFVVARALPFHDQRADDFAQWLTGHPDADEVNARVYHEVFAVWAWLFPVMDFLRDPLAFQSWRGPIMEVTDPARFTETAYMPVNRCLSAGQRRILELWDAYLNGRSRHHGRLR